MLSKEEIENNRIPKQLEKALGIEKEDHDSLIAFKESVFEQTVRENIELKKKIQQLELDKQDLIEMLEEDIENANDDIKHMKEKNIIQTIAKDYKIKVRDYAQEILKFAKGEK